jgi:hypothetical protein
MSVPAIVWENAPIIVLFTITFVFLVRYLMNWFGKQQEAGRVHQVEQQQEWQRFIERRDLEWRSWMETYNKSNFSAMEKVANTLDEIMRLLIEHDGKVDNRITAAANRKKPSTGPLKGPSA